MKKRIGVAALVMILIVSMTACGKFKCDLCANETYGKNEYKSGDTTAVFCDDCYKEMEALAELSNASN